MKKIILTAICILGCTAIFAQQPYQAFCTLYAFKGSEWNAVTKIRVDYGQPDQRNNRLVNEYGEDLKFETMAAAANHLGKAGWKLVSTELDNGVVSWIMTKEVTSDSQITEGFLTRQLFEENRRRR